MIELKINDKPYSIKTEWSEFSFKEYAALFKIADKPLVDSPSPGSSAAPAVPARRFAYQHTDAAIDSQNPAAAA